MSAVQLPAPNRYSGRSARNADSPGWRNGYIGTTGINVVDLGDEQFLEPITTRGINSEACRIVVPKSAITALIMHSRRLHSTASHQSRAAPQPWRTETAIAIPSTGAAQCLATS
jgi:hypothetical protein